MEDQEYMEHMAQLRRELAAEAAEAPEYDDDAEVAGQDW
jgi:hypothetical protein